MRHPSRVTTPEPAFSNLLPPAAGEQGELQGSYEWVSRGRPHIACGGSSMGAADAPDFFRKILQQGLKFSEPCLDIQRARDITGTTSCQVGTNVQKQEGR